MLHCGDRYGLVDGDEIELHESHEFCEELFNECPNHVSLNGYFQTEKYFKNAEKLIRLDFRLSEEDNVFPSDAPVHPMTHIEWAAILKSMNLEGDVLEFGVACGGTIRDIAFINPDKRIHGFDHFQGLEQTSQFIPDYAGWHEGAFCLRLFYFQS